VKAAVVHAPNQDMVIEDVELEEPRVGEVLVRLVATGLCHSDLTAFRGNRPLRGPTVLGHEGAGSWRRWVPASAPSPRGTT